ncbi:hypothetical protein ACDF64_02775 [Agromyces sp. MMS24-JH15]|uniref:hypothetical protein n=1 Tax=Agromyces sp. MMS24-JH15 TaxID=3243765 RepID=UPI003749485A
MSETLATEPITQPAFRVADRAATDRELAAAASYAALDRREGGRAARGLLSGLAFAIPLWGVILGVVASAVWLTAR